MVHAVWRMMPVQWYIGIQSTRNEYWPDVSLCHSCHSVCCHGACCNLSYTLHIMYAAANEHTFRWVINCPFAICGNIITTKQ